MQSVRLSSEEVSQSEVQLDWKWEWSRRRCFSSIFFNLIRYQLVHIGGDEKKIAD